MKDFMTISERMDPYADYRKDGKLYNMDGVPYVTTDGEWLLDFDDEQKEILSNALNNRYPTQVLAYTHISALFMEKFVKSAWECRHGDYAAPIKLWKIANSNLDIPQMECAVNVLYTFNHEIVEMFSRLTQKDMLFWELLEKGLFYGKDTAAMLFRGLSYEKTELSYREEWMNSSEEIKNALDERMGLYALFNDLKRDDLRKIENISDSSVKSVEPEN